jgi:hypothetical protein
VVENMKTRIVPTIPIKLKESSGGKNMNNKENPPKKSYI